jgi:ADP-heptose:LPS heptosyltransferase
LPRLDWGCPRWQGEDLSGKRLLLTTEQGFGDTILAARFIPLLAARYPTGALQLVCKPELQRVLAGLPAQLLDAMPGAGSADYYCPLMSLMGMLGIDDHNVPPPTPLSIPAAAREKFTWLAGHAPGRRKVGIVWSGSLTFKDNAKRAAGLEQFLALAELPHLQCYSFQKGPREEDLKTHAATPLICDLAPHLADFADTAAAVMHMDLIVMTDSSLAHLASSLGKPVLNLLQYKPYWLYGTDARMNAWYPAMRALRQQQPGEWSTVFAAAREILSAT